MIDEFEARLTQAVNTYGFFTGGLSPYASVAGVGNTVADMHGTDTGVGFNFGAMYKPDAQTNIGIDYRSQITHAVTGTQSFTPSSAISSIPTYGSTIAATIAALSSSASTKLTLPDSITIGASRQMTPALRLMVEAQWVDWSVLQSVVVTTNSAATSSVLNENWRNTYYVGVGADYKIDDRLTLKGGVGYDQSPVTAANRTTRIPDTDRIIVGLGFGYDVTKSVRAEFGYAHIFGGTATINNAASLAAGTGTIVGKYNDSDDSFGLSLTIKL